MQYIYLVCENRDQVHKLVISFIVFCRNISIGGCIDLALVEIQDAAMRGLAQMANQESLIVGHNDECECGDSLLVKLSTLRATVQAADTLDTGLTMGDWI